MFSSLEFVVLCSANNITPSSYGWSSPLCLYNYIPLPLFRGFQPEKNNKTLQTRRREIKKTNNSIYYN